jgi:hypothetical protein
MPSKKKSNQPKKVPKTKDQIAAEMRQQEKVKRFRQKVKQEVYPLLLKSSKSVEDAKMILHVVGMAVQQAVLVKEKELKVSDLEITKASEGNERFDAILNLFKDESVRDTIEILSGMRDVIESFVREENTTRPLSKLKATFLD